MSFSLLFVILNFMVFLLLSVFVYFRRCHHFVRTLCVWFPHRSNVVCPMAGLTKIRQQPVETLEGSVWCHILAWGPWDREGGTGGRGSGAPAWEQLPVLTAQPSDPKSVPQVALGGSGCHGSVTWVLGCPSEGACAPPWLPVLPAITLWTLGASLCWLFQQFFLI